MEDRPLNQRLQEQAEQREQLRKKREAAKTLYKNPEVQPVLNDIKEFVEAQVQGCKDLAATTTNRVVEQRALHMLLMADIINSYLDNQMK